MSDLISKMRTHLQRTSLYATQAGMASSESSMYDEESYHDSTILFREGYCVAAVDLAGQLHAPLDQLGALYDQVLGTGLLTAYKRGIKALDNSGTQQSAIFEKGQLLFFTRKLTPEETDHYNEIGLRFAPFNRVEATIANTMQIPVGLLEIQMKLVREYAERTSMPPPPKRGTYFVCFAALARVRGTFRVLVPRDKQEELPDIQVATYNLSPWQTQYIQRYDGWTAEKIIRSVGMKSQNREMFDGDDENREKSFVAILQVALASLIDKVGERWLMDLVFCAEPLLMRYGATKRQKEGMTMAFGFSKLVDIHQPARRLSGGLTLTNWDFVRVRQHYYPGCNDQGRIRHDVHNEFGPLLTKHEEAVRSEGQHQNAVGRRHSTSSNSSGIQKQHSWMDSGRIEGRRDLVDTIINHPQPWGGILATTDTVIEEMTKMQDGIEMRNLVPQVTAGATAFVHNKEPKTYVDCLYEQAKRHPAQLPSGFY